MKDFLKIDSKDILKIVKKIISLKYRKVDHKDGDSKKGSNKKIDNKRPANKNSNRISKKIERTLKINKDKKA